MSTPKILDQKIEILTEYISFSQVIKLPTFYSVEKYFGDCFLGRIMWFLNKPPMGGLFVPTSKITLGAHWARTVMRLWFCAHVVLFKRCHASCFYCVRVQKPFQMRAKGWFVCISEYYRGCYSFTVPLYIMWILHTFLWYLTPQISCVHSLK